MKIRIIGCGNSDRGDDAAGLLVVRRLRTLGVDADIAVEQNGDGLALIEQWAGCEKVILIDATRSGGSPGKPALWMR